MSYSSVYQSLPQFAVAAMQGVSEFQKVGNYRILRSFVRLGSLGKSTFIFRGQGEVGIILRKPGSDFISG